jgi:tRNA modification GTPase
LGLHLTTPWRIVLAGRPNVGKSSLINALVGYRRSIVHDTPGVTRDVLTTSTALDGWPVELADTAGVRESRDVLETAGVARTLGELQKADVVVLVFDAAAAWSNDDEQLLAAAPEAIIVHNKCDLIAGLSADRPNGVRTSAVTGDGLDELKQALVARIAPRVPPAGAAVPFMPRQLETLREARDRAAQGRFADAAERLRALDRRDSDST